MASRPSPVPPVQDHCQRGTPVPARSRDQAPRRARRRQPASRRTPPLPFAQSRTWRPRRLPCRRTATMPPRSPAGLRCRRRTGRSPRQGEMRGTILATSSTRSARRHGHVKSEANHRRRRADEVDDQRQHAEDEHQHDDAGKRRPERDEREKPHICSSGTHSTAEKIANNPTVVQPTILARERDSYRSPRISTSNRGATSAPRGPVGLGPISVA